MSNRQYVILVVIAAVCCLLGSTTVSRSLMPETLKGVRTSRIIISERDGRILAELDHRGLGFYDENGRRRLDINSSVICFTDDVRRTASSYLNQKSIAIFDKNGQCRSSLDENGLQIRSENGDTILRLPAE